MNSFAKILLPSSCAAIFGGPRIVNPRCANSSAMPCTSGNSGPTIVRSAPSFIARSAAACTSPTFSGTHSASREIPPLPGAHQIFSTSALCRSFHAIACSRPPPPMIRIFMLFVCRNKNDTAARPSVSTGVDSLNRSLAVRLASFPAKVLSFTAMHWDFALILLFLGVAVPVLGRRRVRQLMRIPSTTKMDRISLYASTLAFQWIAAGLILWRSNAHEIRASQLGLAVPNPPLAATVTVVLAALILLNQVMGLRRLVTHPSKIRGLLPQLALKLFPQDDVERLAFFALVTTVALCEELIYRGFVQRVFQDWLRGSVAIAGLASTLAIGLIFSAIRAWTDSLVPCVVAHFVADITIGMLAPGRLRAALAADGAQVTDNK